MDKKSTDSGKIISNDKKANQTRTPLSIDSLQQAMNQLINDFFTNFDLLPLSVFEDHPRFIPHIDLEENETALIITAELPGMEEKDIEITMNGKALTIRGEKRRAEQDPFYASHHKERLFGPFQRTISIPSSVDPDMAEASFRNGILRISMPKVNPDLHKRRIPIKTR